MRNVADLTREQIEEWREYLMSRADPNDPNSDDPAKINALCDLALAGLSAPAEPVAIVAEVHMSRYTVEWTNGPLSQGTPLYARSPAPEGFVLVPREPTAEMLEAWSDGGLTVDELDDMSNRYAAMLAASAGEDQRAGAATESHYDGASSTFEAGGNQSPAHPQPAPPFADCSFRACDLPGQCLAEGRCHHPKPAPGSGKHLHDDYDSTPIAQESIAALNESAPGSGGEQSINRELDMQDAARLAGAQAGQESTAASSGVRLQGSTPEDHAAGPASLPPVYRCEGCGEYFAEAIPAGHAVLRRHHLTGEPYPEQCGPVVSVPAYFKALSDQITADAVAADAARRKERGASLPPVAEVMKRLAGLATDRASAEAVNVVAALLASQAQRIGRLERENACHQAYNADKWTQITAAVLEREEAKKALARAREALRLAAPQVCQEFCRPEKDEHSHLCDEVRAALSRRKEPKT